MCPYCLDLLVISFLIFVGCSIFRSFILIIHGCWSIAGIMIYRQQEKVKVQTEPWRWKRDSGASSRTTTRVTFRGQKRLRVDLMSKCWMRQVNINNYSITFCVQRERTISFGVIIHHFSTSLISMSKLWKTSGWHPFSFFFSLMRWLELNLPSEIKNDILRPRWGVMRRHRALQCHRTAVKHTHAEHLK